MWRAGSASAARAMGASPFGPSARAPGWIASPQMAQSRPRKTGDSGDLEGRGADVGCADIRLFQRQIIRSGLFWFPPSTKRPMELSCSRLPQPISVSPISLVCYLGKWQTKTSQRMVEPFFPVGSGGLSLDRCPANCPWQHEPEASGRLRKLCVFSRLKGALRIVHLLSA